MKIRLFLLVMFLLAILGPPQLALFGVLALTGAALIAADD